MTHNRAKHAKPKGHRIRCVLLGIVLTAIGIYQWNRPYVKVAVNYSAEDIIGTKNKTSQIKIRQTDENAQWSYYDGFTLKDENADYGEYVIVIPLDSKSSEFKGTLKILYLKLNNWYKTKIDVHLDVKYHKGQTYLNVDTKLSEGGRFQRNQSVNHKKFLLKKDPQEYSMSLEE